MAATKTYVMHWLAAATVAFVLAAALPLAGGVLAGDTPPEGWRRIEAAEIAENPVLLFGKGWFGLAAGTAEDMNAMTIGWGGLGTLWGMNNAVVNIYVEPTRYTHGYLLENDHFTLTSVPEEHRDALRYIGSRSGRNEEDKIANAGLTVGFTELGNPFFNEGRMVIECKKIYSAPMVLEGMGEKGKLTYDPSRGMKPHTIFIGEVVNVFVK